MEIKKYPRADLSRYQGLIFSFSLTLTLLLMILAFEWRSYEKGIAEIQDRSVNSFELFHEVPPTEIPPPPPAVAQPSVIVEVPNEEEIMEDIKISIDIEMNQDTRIEQITIQPVASIIEIEDVDAIFTVVESPAEPVGGFAAFYKDIGDRINYPAQARRMGIEGKVFVEFIINRDGSLTNFNIIKGIGAGCDDEAIRVLTSSPRWKAAKQRGNPVRQKMVLPIFFKLGNI